MERHQALRRDTPKARAWRSKRSKLAPVGKGGKRRHNELEAVIDGYFERFWSTAKDATRTAPCQVCSERMPRKGANGHHKHLRSKGGREGAENIVVCHKTCHLDFVHGGEMGMGYTPDGRARVERVQDSPANALNGLIVEFSPQQAFDLERMRSHCTN